MAERGSRRAAAEAERRRQNARQGARQSGKRQSGKQNPPRTGWRLWLRRLFVWGGAALLGWVAGELAISDPMWERFLAWTPSHALEYGAAAAGAAVVLVIGWFLRRAQGRDI